jgi:hypothetical protein
MEELKLILQTLATMGESAKEGFIWFVVIDRLIPTLAWSCVFGGAIFTTYRYFRARSDSGDTTAQLQANSERAKAEATAAMSSAIQAVLQIRKELAIYEYPTIKQDIHPSGLGSKHCVEAVQAVVDLHRKGG